MSMVFCLGDSDFRSTNRPSMISPTVPISTGITRLPTRLLVRLTTTKRVPRCFTTVLLGLCTASISLGIAIVLHRVFVVYSPIQRYIFSQALKTICMYICPCIKFLRLDYVVALLEGLGFCNVKDVHDGSRN